jgi:hypothetical protein
LWCCVSALAACTARETYRVRLSDLGKRDALPVPEQEYENLREKTLSEARMAKA